MAYCNSGFIISHRHMSSVGTGFLFWTILFARPARPYMVKKLLNPAVQTLPAISLRVHEILLCIVLYLQVLYDVYARFPFSLLRRICEHLIESHFIQISWSLHDHDLYGATYCATYTPLFCTQCFLMALDYRDVKDHNTDVCVDSL